MQLILDWIEPWSDRNFLSKSHVFAHGSCSVIWDNVVSKGNNWSMGKTSVMVTQVYISILRCPISERTITSWRHLRRLWLRAASFQPSMFISSKRQFPLSTSSCKLMLTNLMRKLFAMQSHGLSRKCWGYLNASGHVGRCHEFPGFDCKAFL